MKTTHNILRLLTGALVAIFVLCGIWGRSVSRCFKTEGNGALASSDRVLANPLEVDDGAEMVLEAIAGLPARARLALLVPTANVYGPILLAALSSIAWPHQIQLIAVHSRDVQKAFDGLHGARFSAAMIYGVSLPVSAPEERHAGQLTIIPVAR